MSWISDLAGKAENILNKIDQNAATVLKFDTENVENGATICIDIKSDEHLPPRTLSSTKSSPMKLTKTVDKPLMQLQQLNDSLNENTSLKLSSSHSSLSSIKTEGTVKESLPIVENLVSSEEESNNMNITSAKEEILDGNDIINENMNLQKDLTYITELENLVSRLTDERENLNRELIETKRDCTTYVRSITELEINLSKAKQTILELSEKLEWQMKEANQGIMELEQYRKKAQATLQMKDKIITDLRDKLQNHNRNDSVIEFSDGTNLENHYQKEIIELQKENLQLQDELKLLNIQLQESKKFIKQLESKYQEDIEEHLLNEASLGDVIRRLEQKSIQFESDNKVLNQELVAVQDELYKQRQLFVVQLNEKENEIMNLKSQTQQLLSTSDTNFMGESLTEALVQKQNTIETLTAERNALKLQLEKSNDKVRQFVAKSQIRHSQIINVNDTDDDKAQLHIMRENPFDTRVTRRVKRAYSCLDSTGIRIGVFLRRYPLARIMVFLYIAILHIWVMFILLVELSA